MRRVSEIRTASSFWPLSSGFITGSATTPRRASSFTSAGNYKHVNEFHKHSSIGFHGFRLSWQSVSRLPLCSFLSKPVIRNQGKFDPTHAMKACGGAEVWFHSFLTPVLDDEWPASRPGRFAHGSLRYPLNRRLDLPQSLSGHLQKWCICYSYRK